MSKRLLASIAVVVLVALGAFSVTQHGPQPVAKRAPAAAPHASGTASPAPAPPPPPETRVHRVSQAEHAQLAERIAAARARAREAAARTSRDTPSPSLPGSDDDSITLEQVSPTVRAALDASIPILSECFLDKQPKQTAVVVMTLYSDPSVGTVIDTEEMTDGDGSALPRALDDCLRTAIETLALPPLDVGGHLPVQYSFVF